jgi:protocatechuate 3,4-dioxygenase beta subunit
MFLEKAIYTVVRVVDDRGVPIPGATLWSGDPDEEFHERISKKVGTTNREGECEFPFEFDGPRAVLYVKKAGYGMGVVYPDDPSDGGVYEIRLEKGRTLHGRVVDGNGEPVEGALVYIEVTQEDPDAEDLYASVFTDADGKYQFDYLAPGEVWIEVELDGYEGDDAEFEVTGGQSQYVRNFKLEKE